MHPARYALVQDPGDGSAILLLATAESLDYLTLLAAMHGPFRATNYLKQGFNVTWAPKNAYVQRQFWRQQGGTAGLGALYEGGTGRHWEIIDLAYVSMQGRRRWIENMMSHAIANAGPSTLELIRQNQGDSRADVDAESLRQTMSDAELDAAVP